MVGCSAIGCNSRSEKMETGISFHRFPMKNPRKVGKWVQNMHIPDWTPTKNDKICSKHFQKESFYCIGNKTFLLDGAIPTIFKKLPKYLQEKVQPTRATKRSLEEIDQPSTSATSDPVVSVITSLEDTPRKKRRKRSTLKSKREELTPEIVETEAASGHMQLVPNNIPTFHLGLASDTSDLSLSNEPQLSNVRSPPRQMKRKRSISPLRINFPWQSSSSNQEINEMMSDEDSHDADYQAEVDPLSIQDENKRSRALEETEKESDLCYIFITLDPTSTSTTTKEVQAVDPPMLQSLLKKGSVNKPQESEAVRPSTSTTTKEVQAVGPPMLQSLLKKGSVNKPQESEAVRPKARSVETQTEENVTLTRKSPEPSEKTKTLQKKLEFFKKRSETQNLRIATYRKQIEESDKLIKTLQSQLKESLHKTLYDDQVPAVKVKTSLNPSRFVRVSDVKMFKELRLRFICGTEGYKEISKHVIPLPSEKVLQRAIEDVSFEPGILDGMFDHLKVKIDCLTAVDRDCCLIIEEKEIESERTYDADQDKYFGNITVAPSNEIATHVLVFFLAGLYTNWKQIVAYHFTGGSIEESVFKDILKGVLKKAVQSDLNVVSITIDIDSKNQSIWENLRRNYDQKALENTIDHPLSVLKKMYIFADVPKLFKRLKSIFKRNKTITVSNSVRETNNLGTSVVSSAHINELLSLQSICRLRVVPKPDMEDLVPFEVDSRPVKSNKIRNLNIASALKHCASALNKPEYLATAYFLDTLEKWYNIMTAKVPVAALNKHDQDNYTESLCLLRDFVKLVESLEVENDPLWRDTQIGVLVSTRTMVQVQNVLLSHKNHDYLLTHRFFGNDLEQLFEALNSRSIITNAQNVQQNLMVLSVAEYMKCPKSSCNDGDDKAIFQSINFSGTTNQNRIKQEEEILSSGDEMISFEITLE